MFPFGTTAEYYIVREEPFGLYLSAVDDEAAEETVLLPGKEVPDGAKIHDRLSVFLYRDSEDRPVATLLEPKIRLHKVAKLTCTAVTKIGAFLDWGLPKELLLPFHEQTKEIHKGEEVLVALYLDKSGRLAATMKLYPYLEKDPPYREGDLVDGLIYEITRNFGIYVAVEERYQGRIPKEESQGDYEVGETLTFRVTKIKPDGKIDLSAKKKAYLQMSDDAEEVFRVITEDYDGILPFDDKASPEEIAQVFHMSKAAFKRAVGALYKERRIMLNRGRIEVC